MSEIQSRYSSARPLESIVPAPSSLNILKFVFKLISGLLLLLLQVLEDFCSSELNDLVLSSCIIILIESFFAFFSLLSKYKSESCPTCSSYYLTLYLLLDFLADIFYVVWVIYYSFIFFEDSTCSDESTIAQVAQIYTLVYFMLTSALMICCCGAKLCMILGTVSSSSNTKDGTLTDSLFDAKDPTEKKGRIN